MFGLPTSFWYILGTTLVFQILYLIAITKGLIRKRRAELITADLEWIGTVIAVLSVASATGISFGNLHPQVVRWESAGLVSFYILTLAWQLKKDLIKNHFKD